MRGLIATLAFIRALGDSTAYWLWTGTVEPIGHGGILLWRLVPLGAPEDYPYLEGLEYLQGAIENDGRREK